MRPQKNQKVLVTGGAGYVGSQVVSHLVSQGYSVTVFDRLFYGAEAVMGLNVFHDFTLVKGDVRDPMALEDAIADHDVVVHLAGIVGEDACKYDPDAAWEINRGAVENVLAACQAKKVGHLVFVSTCSNYGVSAPNVMVDEDAELKPISEYSRAKVECEKLILGNNHTPATVLRLGTICGVAPRMRFDLLISDMCRLAVRGEKIDIFAPDAWRPFLHIRDAGRVVDTIIADGPAQSNRVFNVVEANYTKRDLIEILHEFVPEAEVVVTDRKPDLRDYRVSAIRIEQELGFKPAHSISDAFRETLAAIRLGYFRDPAWSGHSAVPLPGSSLAIEN